MGRQTATGPDWSVGDGDLMGYAPALRGYFRKRAAWMDVDDLTQEVFLNMHSRRCGTRIENVEGYLFAVAARILSRHRMRRNLERLVYCPETEGGASQEICVFSAEEEVVCHERLQKLLETLERLPARARSVFVLNRFEDLSYEAIAGRLNLSVSAIEKHIMYALRVLRTQAAEE